MRFMTLLKSSGDFGPPPPEVFGAIAALGDQAGKTLVESAGLSLPADSVRVSLNGGQITRTDGCDSVSADAYAIYEVADLDEATAWATKFLDVHRKHWPAWEGTVEIRQTFGA
ncbi:YciI family protein [Spirillospora sp. CA-294931]|uniref:YciI family protein n=1 Tax=Spirillospora sp. CA-294931 TaxID=3240042 RepID=UPI003D8EDF66